MSNDLKWMLGSDFHIPYAHPRYVDLWFQVMKWYKPHVVDYLGDIDDQSCVSRWNAGAPDEILGAIATYSHQVKEFYQKTRDLCPDSQLFNALGNHDIRIWDYIDKKSPALRGDSYKTGLITPETLWGLDSLGFEYIHYNDKPKHRFGDVFVHHGIAISQHAGQSVQKDIDTFGVSLIRGHSHRMGSFFKTYDLRDETLRGYEIGHMTDINSEGMAYTNSHNWQPGFAIATVENGNHPHVQLIHISSDFTCYVNGRKFKA